MELIINVRTKRTNTNLFMSVLIENHLKFTQTFYLDILFE
jgi:hypothetical protein